MRVALIIGVSDYQHETSLPSCKRDADAVVALLDKTQSFEHKLHLSGSLSSQDTKSQILAFLDRLRGQSISQALFYFSGHGTIQDGELLYLLSDFDEKRPRQTSIENKEVDNWLRDLTPEVAIKVTDCCHSGTPYIKDSNAMESAIARSKGQFSACYFLAASHADEITYAGDKFSEFTEHILKGLAQRPLGSIRYKDLIDTVLDSYQENSSHQPYVVQQGGMRDVFFEQTEETLGLLKKFTNSQEASQPASLPEEPATRMTLTEIIEADAKSILTKETAQGYLETLQRSIEDFRVDKELAGIYDLKSHFSRAWEAEIENEEAIGKWLLKNGGDLFAEAIEEDVKERVPRHLLDPMEAYFHPMGKITSKKDVTGIRVSSGLEYDFIKTNLEPRFQNLNKYEAAFLLLWSRREVVLFRYITPLRTINWNEHEVPDRIKWKIIRFPVTGLSKITDAIVVSLLEMEKLAEISLQHFRNIGNPS